MFRICGTFLIYAYALISKIFGFIAKFVYRIMVYDNCTRFLSSGLVGKVILGTAELMETYAKTEDSVLGQSELVAKNSMYQFMPIEDVVGVIEEPETVNFSVEEMFSDHEICSKKDYLEQKLEEKNQQEFGDGVGIFNQEEADNNSTSRSLFGEEVQEQLVEDEIMEEQEFCYEIELLPDRTQFSVPEVDTESSFTEFKFFRSPQIEPIENSFLGRGNDQRKPEYAETNIKDQKNFLIPLNMDDEYEEFIELEPRSPRVEESFRSVETNNTDESHDPEIVEGSQEKKMNSWDSNSDYEDESDVLWEHQNLVQQMKMELKECRIRGLPTISEDCETPRMVEDLKPLKIDHKFEYKDLMGEIIKFYRSYAERMRKLDILNFQTLQAISFLQLKESELFTSGKKKSASMLKHLNLPKIWPCKVQRIHADPTLRSIIELNRDLEFVYVGQLCLSWEILSWMYIKAKELLKYDSHGNHSYNRVAEEFQQFQVLMQRFMEDERFRGPRVQNYVKNRCMIRSLLQVPMIRDDCMKDKKERKEENDAISLDSLVRTIEESMLVFWEFLRADKCSKDVASNGVHGTKIDVQEHVDSELLVDIIANLQKKERRLKGNMRSKNCIVKKLKKQEESEQCLSCEVELRLVSRVLGLSRLSADQLGWCEDKLESINFVNRRVHVEQSFLLFPC